MNKIKLAYVASPYAYIVKFFGEAKAIELAQERCKQCAALGYLPLSSILAFNGVFKEDTQAERNNALCFALNLMYRCDIFFYSESDLKISEGMRQELSLWQKHKKSAAIMPITTF